MACNAVFVALRDVLHSLGARLSDLKTSGGFDFSPIADPLEFAFEASDSYMWKRRWFGRKDSCLSFGRN